VMPGDNVALTVELITPVAMDKGLRFAIREGGRTVFCVEDNGAGFDMDYATNLFRPFHRMHSPDEFPGTGIGLATVQRIVQRHEGGIQVDSSPGRGTTVCFSLGK